MSTSWLVTIGLVLWFCNSAFAQGQAAMSFEVASVKRNTSVESGRQELFLHESINTSQGASVKRNASTERGRQGALFRENINTSQGRVTLHSVTLQACVMWAYGLQDPQILGPTWLKSERYDIAAKAGGPATENDLRRMLQTLLADRFKMASHREKRESNAVVMTVGRAGPKFRESTGEGESSLRATGGKIVAERTTMTELAAVLSDPLRMPVIDATGLTGRYDFTLDFASFAPTVGQPPDEATGTITVVREQLGLTLKASKTSLEVLVVDHAERVPIEN
jgi:uncharacterized protein (TIGR03435 family)